MKIRIEKIIEYLVYTLAIILPWQTRWIIKDGQINGWHFEYGTYSLYASDLIVLLILALFVIDKLFVDPEWQIKAEESFFKYKKITIFAIILDLAAFVSIFFAPDHWLAAYSYVRLLVLISLVMVLAVAVYDRTKFILSLCIGALPQAGLAIWQFLSQSTFANKWLGLALHDAAVGGTSVIEVSKVGELPERWLRAYGGLDHPNILGGYLAMIILLALGQVIDSYKKTIDNRQSTIENMKRFTIYDLRFTIYILYFTLFLSLTALFFTFSRSAWLALFVGLAVMLVSLARRRNLWGQKVVLETVLISSFLIMILGSFYGDLVAVRTTGVQSNRLEIKSTQERISSWTMADRIIKPHWLVGTGIGNYTLAVRDLDPDQPGYFYQPVHNTLLLIWAEIGLAGAVAAVVLLIYLMILTFEGPFGQHRFLLSAIIILLLFDHYLWSLHSGLLLFAVFLGLIARSTLAKKA